VRNVTTPGIRTSKRTGATVVVYGGAAAVEGSRAQQFDGPAIDDGFAGFAVSIVDLDGDGVQDGGAWGNDKVSGERLGTAIGG